MEKIAYPREVDKSEFAPDNRNPRTLYGLPQEVRFCSRCVISNQRPNSAVEYEHTMASQRHHQFRRRRHLRRLPLRRAQEEQHRLGRARRRTPRPVRPPPAQDGSYDCLVPGSGGKDSFYAAHILSTKYGMHPLTVTWAPHIYTDWGWRNFQSWIHAGFDNFLFTPNGRVHRLLTRLAVENLFHPFQPFILGQKALAPKMALLHGIPLVFYGENEAEYGNPIGGYRKCAARLVVFHARRPVADLSRRRLDRGAQGALRPRQQRPAALSAGRPRAFRCAQDRGALSRLLSAWHPQSCYYYAVEHGGFEASPERTPGTYSKYNSIDDRIDDFHYYTTFIKFGIGRATYDAAQEIRSGDIEREEGVALVKRFDGEFPERFADEIFRYLSLPEKEFPGPAACSSSRSWTASYFAHLADRFRSPHLWQYDGRMALRHTVWEE